MRELLDCLDDWLQRNRCDGVAFSLFAALTRETLKRAGSTDPAQREFDAGALAPAAGGPGDFESAKRWIDRGKFAVFAEARKAAIEQHFRAAGHTRALKVVRRSPRGKHRTVWYLEPYLLGEEAEETESIGLPETSDRPHAPLSIQYEFTPPGKIRAAWYARPLIGTGSFVTRSWRGILWVTAFLVPVGFLLISAVLTLGFTYFRRPVQTADLASLVVVAILAWFVWRTLVRPTMWLLEDRIIPATELWVAWNEENAQLELATDEFGHRRLQLVRYTAVCPVCAGTLELRYSQGPNSRRLLGCCTEAPHDHVFSFDRISRLGSRIRDATSDNAGR